MTGDEVPVLSATDHFATVLAAIDAAGTYGFSTGAAMAAAAEPLRDLDAAALTAVAAALAALIACDLRPLGPETLEKWREGYGFHLACRDREP